MVTVRLFIILFRYSFGLCLVVRNRLFSGWHGQSERSGDWPWDVRHGQVSATLQLDRATHPEI
jgi:hypothetical protein